MKVFLTLLALFLGLIGLLMSLCGGGFLAASVASHDAYSEGIVAIALPSLIAGLLVLWGGVALFKKANRRDETNRN